LKIEVAVSVLFTAAALLTPTYATTASTASKLRPTVLGAGYVTVLGREGMFPNDPESDTAAAPSSGAEQGNLAVQNDLTRSDGLRGAHFQQSEIAIEDVGFAPTDTLSDQVNQTRANQPTWAPLQTGSGVAGQPLTVSTSSFNYAIGVTDCGNTTHTPGPGRFVLVGIAMIGLGMTVRERKRRA
jgi:hypothetical protein